jgi:raffinose/stachyose/melibiose transport system permease protein
VALPAPGLFFYFLIGVGPSLATSVYSFTDATGIKGIPDQLGRLRGTTTVPVRGRSISGQPRCAAANADLHGPGDRHPVRPRAVDGAARQPEPPGALIFRTIFFIPVILGAVVQGLMWKLFLLPGGGPMDTIFGWLGLESEFLGGQSAFYWVIVVQIWANAGFTMVIFLAGMQTIPAELYEAAAVDGARGWQLFKNITWPQLTPAVNTNFLLNIVGSLQAWFLFLVLIGYRNGTQVLGYVVYAEAFGQTGEGASFRQGYAAAGSIVLFLLVLVIGMAANFVVTRRERKYMG